MGEITNGHLTRDIAYSHGVWFAFAPFISPRQYWEPDVHGADKQ
jgi:non-canonical (house-cleaning) NTP pyrophosphatase